MLYYSSIGSKSKVSIGELFELPQQFIELYVEIQRKAVSFGIPFFTLRALCKSNSAPLVESVYRINPLVVS